MFKIGLVRCAGKIPSSLRLVAPAANFCSQKEVQHHQKPAVAVQIPVQAPLLKEKVTDLTVLSVLKGLKDSPSPALLYGLSGLIPFVAVPVYTLSSGTFCPLMGSIQLWYGASILSFLGGVRWGHALHPASAGMTFENLGVSVAPSLVAVAALGLPYAPGVLTVATGLTGAAYFDLARSKSSYPHWFKSLRLVLSSVAVASLLSALALSYTHKKEEKNKENSQH
ncbi:transmembrane protein 69-like [Cloeon dipterum]|uniref:transmembrane protein 69-like n=1 Tax=Cloeon dipterum TaxID=197152 RepID=UPI0032204215